jgi:hypothetical protein
MAHQDAQARQRHDGAAEEHRRKAQARLTAELQLSLSQENFSRKISLKVPHLQSESATAREIFLEKFFMAPCGMLYNGFLSR